MSLGGVGPPALDVAATASPAALEASLGVEQEPKSRVLGFFLWRYRTAVQARLPVHAERVLRGAALALDPADDGIFRVLELATTVGGGAAASANLQSQGHADDAESPSVERGRDVLAELDFLGTGPPSRIRNEMMWIESSRRLSGVGSNRTPASRSGSDCSRRWLS